MSDLLTDKTAVVTGGASGLGRAIARVYAENGANIVIGDVSDEPRLGGRPTHEVVTEETGAEAVFVKCDVTKRSNIEKAVDAATSLGGIDIMVNNAGILHHYNFLESRDEDYDKVMDINVKGVYVGAQVAALEMLENDGGSIVNLSSIRADIGNSDYVSYCTSKGAVKIMTYSLADVLGPEIRVNAIQPGTIDTAQHQLDAGYSDGEESNKRAAQTALGRLGEPRDIANVALFLASDLAGYVTGEAILADGGLINTSFI